jgi:hypothetical protein
VIILRIDVKRSRETQAAALIRSHLQDQQPDRALLHTVEVHALLLGLLHLRDLPHLVDRPEAADREVPAGDKNL